MEILYSFFKKHTVLSLIFITCTVLSVLYKTWLIKLPEPAWFSLASELGEILYDLAIGTIASVIFYFVIVFRSDYERRNAVSEIIRQHLSSIISEGISIFSKINNNQKANFPPTKQELESACDMIDPNGSWVLFAKERRRK